MKSLLSLKSSYHSHSLTLWHIASISPSLSGCDLVHCCQIYFLTLTPSLSFSSSIKSSLEWLWVYNYRHKRFVSRIAMLFYFLESVTDKFSNCILSWIRKPCMDILPFLLYPESTDLFAFLPRSLGKIVVSNQGMFCLGEESLTMSTRPKL